ncbi:MAG: hypothetical protein NT046_00175 [Arenimonas sp.]|nr:hypothetical protein [Arenimonas sp.]
MYPKYSVLFLAMMLAAVLCHASEPPHEPASHAAHAPPAEHDARGQAPAHAVRWQADEPLSRGMQRVRTATQALAHGAHGHLERAQIQAIAGQLEAAVQDMFTQCRLEPEPDAALHPLLARVLQASARLADGRFDPQAFAELEDVLARYPQLFEDATWSPPSDTSAASRSMPLRVSHSRSNSVSS